MKFIKKTYQNGDVVKQIVDKDSIEAVITELEEMFNTLGEVVRYEQMKMADGKFSVAVKNRSNKIILQYKTIHESEAD